RQSRGDHFRESPFSILTRLWLFDPVDAPSDLPERSTATALPTMASARLHVARAAAHLCVAPAPARRVARVCEAAARTRLDPVDGRHLREVAADGEQGGRRWPRHPKW